MSSPVRSCAGCGRKAPQRELVRFAAADGVLVADAARRLPGRGVYTCRSVACFERARARRSFARTLRRRVSVPPTLLLSLEEG
ncbi:MAG: YlxR family protein [Thermoleophilia bacterium]|nr:YlxR family protein [Thermoleophilia bacterium]